MKKNITIADNLRWLYYNLRWLSWSEQLVQKENYILDINQLY